MRHERRPPQTHRLFVGIALIAVGVLALLGNLHIIDPIALRAFWPLVFVALGLSHIARHRSPHALLWGVGFIALGAALTLRKQGLLPLGMHELWPALLIFGGVYLLAKGLFPDSGSRWRGWERGNGLPPPRGEDSARLNLKAILNGSAIKNDTQDFQGGELTAVMGGLELDLRQASMKSEAVLHVLVMMGGVEIRVPQDWSIQLRSVPILGGVEDKTVPAMNASKRLIIEGDIIMGGIEIKN
jgi:predicted membrane protein